MFKEITLTSGEVVKVYPVPSYAIAAAVATISLPEAPMTMVSTLAGEQPWPDTSPESEAFQKYAAEKREAERKRGEKQNEVSLLLALKDVTVSEDNAWFEPLAYVGIQPRKGDLGRKLDYIQYVMLASGADLKIVFDSIAEISFPKEEAIQAMMESFQRDRGQAAAAAHTNGAERG